MNKTNAVEAYLKRGNTLTQVEAYELFGTTRLSAIIYVLRHDRGLHIITDKVEVKDRFGDTCPVGRYHLAND